MPRQNTDLIVAQINERVAFWTSKGFVGASVYEQLAADTGAAGSVPAAGHCHRSQPAAAVTREAACARSAAEFQAQRAELGRLPAPLCCFTICGTAYVERRQPLASAGYTQTA